MDSLAGYPLCEALSLLQEKYHKIIRVVKITGNNSKFNKLNNPYVIKEDLNGEYITLFVTYY
ncbi:MAG TPA: hypothetical protein DC000_05685 [Clostridiales bacterium]|nr:hypothetical protein [Clostridiales bacterium]